MIYLTKNKCRYYFNCYNYSKQSNYFI